MIHGGTRASCRCLENPPGRSWYGWGLSWGRHSRVPFTTRREATKSLSGELMVESSPSRQKRPPCKSNKEMSDEAADTAALTYLLTYLLTLTLQRKKDGIAKFSVNPGGLPVPLGTNTTAEEQDKSQEARLASLGTDLAPLSALGQKPPIILKEVLQGHHSNSRPKKATRAPPKGRRVPFSALGQLQRPLVGRGDNDAQERLLKGHGMLCSKNASKCNTSTRLCCLLIIVPLPLTAGKAAHTNKGRGSRLLP